MSQKRDRLYKKRDGTSGIRGQLYETKLISLVHFRTKFDKSIEDYNLATNVADIGNFGNICIRAKVKNEEGNKHVAVFIQTKHREGYKKVQQTLNSKDELAKWFSSYLSIRRLFKPNNEHVLFEGNFQELECLFIIYTTAKADPNNTKEFKSDFAEKLNSLIRTGDKGLQPSHKDEDIVFLCDIMMKEQFAALAVLLAKFLSENDKDVDNYQDNGNDQENAPIMSMNDDLVLLYHVILVQRVLNVSEIKCKNEKDEHRVATFKTEFFDNNEDFITLFKETLFIEMLRRRKLIEQELESLLLKLFIKPLEISVLGSLVGNVVTFNNKKLKLEFVSETMSDDFNRQLQKVDVLQSTVNEAIILAAKDMLIKRDFKVPAAFGNKDLTVGGKEDNVEPSVFIASSIDKLKNKIIDLINASPAEKIVVIDEKVGKELSGLASTIGNILVSDENSKYMKFADNGDLGDLAKSLYAKMHSAVSNLHDYKFDIKCKTIPKLTFRRNEDDEDLAKDFLKKILFFTNQAAERDVEKFLKREIEDLQCVYVNNIRVTADAIFLQYHDFIQRWWMLKEASYLTKQSKHYEEAIAAIVHKPLLRIISKMYMIKIKNNAEYTSDNNTDYTLQFNEKALNFYKLTNQPQATIFITECSALTVAKMVQSLKKIDHYVFDLEYVLELPAEDYSTVCKELKETNKTNVIIIVCNNINRNWTKRLEAIAKVLKDKQTIFVIKDTLEKTIKSYFKGNNIVMDEKCSLIQMSEVSQKIILENTKVMFQDVEVRLGSIIDETSMALVEGEVLNKIMNKELIVLGTSNNNSNYEKVKHLYIDRHVVQFNSLGPDIGSSPSNNNNLLTLNDIDNIALITAKPGMGKSTLLTHLSLKTKELHNKVWIVRINLLNHSETFSKWQEKKTNIDYLETLKFVCEVLAEKRNKASGLSIELEEKNADVFLKSCTGDQWTVFELKMFLDYYNRKELIFLFDGFDEICPMYTDEVLTLLKTVKNYPRTHKMCITSRSYDRIISTLEDLFGMPYEIQSFSNDEQNEYLLKFWKSKIIFKELSNKQYDNVCSFMEFMAKHDETCIVKNQVLFINVCLNFLNYLQRELNVCPKSVVKTFNTLFSECNFKINFMDDFDTPLHLYLIAEYFQNQIKDESIIPNRWNFDINAFSVYDTFIETKLKIRFQEKNKIDLYNPDNMTIYENVRADFLAKHHKLGAYAVFYQDAYLIFSETELFEIKQIIDNIKEGTEKTGLIHSVVNGIPQFLHMTFTEYFAVQYICDVLRRATREDQQISIWDFILNTVFKHRENVRNVLGYKIKTDEDLRAIVKDHEEIIFDLLLELGRRELSRYPDDFSNYLSSKIREELDHAMSDELRNFVFLLYDIKENLKITPFIQPRMDVYPSWMTDERMTENLH